MSYIHNSGLVLGFLRCMYVDEIKQKALQIRNSIEYREWRQRVISRDDRRCTLCKRKKNLAKGVRLEVDHILPFLLYPEKMFDLDNGRTLCSHCHRKTLTYGNTREHRQAHKEVVHPFLKGDYLYKIASLPTSMEVDGQVCGLHIRYKAIMKQWQAGYGPACRIHNTKWDTTSYTIEDAIDSLVTCLKVAGNTK